MHFEDLPELSEVHFSSTMGVDSKHSLANHAQLSHCTPKDQHILLAISIPAQFATKHL